MIKITDEDIIRTLKQRKNIMIGERTADEITSKLMVRMSDAKITVKGRFCETGEKMTVEMSMRDFFERVGLTESDALMFEGFVKEEIEKVSKSDSQ
jgi:actin-like ATPase involved in cell morphogenesis